MYKVIWYRIKVSLVFGNNRLQNFLFKHLPAALLCSVTLCQLMKQFFTILLLVFLIGAFTPASKAQCSVCTKTALQMGEKPAKGLNQGILYLMMAPFAIVGFIGYRWWKGNR
jgi:hypothetical protein